MTKRDIFKKWQTRLYLTDWTIDFRPDSIPSDMTLSDCCGETEYRESTKTAVIRILREDCYGDRITPFSFEKTLIHELLHLKFSLLCETGNELQNRYVHQLIEELAKAFVGVQHMTSRSKKTIPPKVDSAELAPVVARFLAENQNGGHLNQK